MDLSRALPPQSLCHRCDPADVPFESTAGAPAVEEFAGQGRAARSLDFAMGVAGDGYNAFVMGPEGIGRHCLVAATLARHATAAPAPSDWVYVNNVASTSRPIAIELPAGRGAALRGDMKRLVAELRSAIPAILEGEEYAQRVEKIDRAFAERREEAVRGIGASAEAQGIALLRTPVGYGFAPTRDKEILDAEAFERLPEEERARISAAMTALQEQLEHAIREAIRGRKERAEQVRELDRQTVMLALEPLVAELAQRHADLPRVVDFLHAVRDDVLQNAETFRGGAEGAAGGLPAAPFTRELARYAVNLLVDREGPAASRVEYCDHPTSANLVGRLEQVQHLGTLVTDFTLLKAGALHRANGGYLVLDAMKLLSQPFAWEALKRALTRREVRIETASELWGIASTVSLEAEPIALRVKVVLIGERRLYYLLQALDPDFARLFKVVADFEEILERDPASQAWLARAVATLARKAGLLPLDRGAVAR
ncbi:MAG TPA: ATP-binding protein, partial [Myxococcota bacterium]|nr:ATP-binding protein [Myxococcota bacterium]